jgi:hypothetical protein
VAVHPHPRCVREHLVQGGAQAGADQRVPQHRGGLLEDPVVVGQARLADDDLLARLREFPLLFGDRLGLLLPGLLELCITRRQNARGLSTRDQRMASRCRVSW